MTYGTCDLENQGWLRPSTWGTRPAIPQNTSSLRRVKILLEPGDPEGMCLSWVRSSRWILWSHNLHNSNCLVVVGKTMTCRHSPYVVDGLMSDEGAVVGSSEGVTSEHSETFGDGLPVGVCVLNSGGASWWRHQWTFFKKEIQIFTSREVIDCESSCGHQTVRVVVPFVIEVRGPIVAVVDLKI